MFPTPLAIIVAHPDDEVIGAGAQLPQWPEAQFIHITDGAPGDLRDAHAYGFATREAYAVARRKELEAALGLAGIVSAQLCGLGFADQETSFHLTEVTERLVDILSKRLPRTILTHPYEGGHPDHDATAFAVQAACARLALAYGNAPLILEMTSYFNRAGSMATGEFLPGTGGAVTTVELSEEQRAFKRKLFGCFSTQQKVLAYFQFERERFRAAPHYDFTQPPHPGTLYYELFDWGMTGARWRALASAALRESRLPIGC